MNFSLIVPAAGSGSRAARPLPKQYVELGGRTVLEHSLRPFAALDSCREIVVAVDASMWDRANDIIRGIDRARLVEGGRERGESVARALETIEEEVDLVLVHDAARPCVDADLIRRVIRGAIEHGAVVPALGIPDTVKQVDSQGIIVGTLDRSRVRVAQTPQAFRHEILLRAYDNAERKGLSGTDDAALVEALGIPVHTIEGDRNNVKITTMGDFPHAETWLLSHC